MSNKKSVRLAVLSLLGVLTLTGCDESSSKIYAKPSSYNDPIVTISDDSTKIHNDLLKIIYDAMHKGEIASKTLDAVMYRYAQSVYGSYNKITLPDSEKGTTTLKEAARIAKIVGGDLEGFTEDDLEPEDRKVLNKFIAQHKSFWLYDDNGDHVDEEGTKIKKVDPEKYEASASEIQNVADKWDDIEERIAESMYTKVSSGTYTENHFFDEVKFVRSLHQDHQKVDYEEAKTIIEDPEQAGHYIPKYPSVIIPYTLEGKDVFKQKYLHRDFYQSYYLLTEDETPVPDPESPVPVEILNFHYIEEEIVPEVYNDLLIEQYLLDEESAAVRNSRARLINAIKIEKNSSSILTSELLVKRLVEDIYKLPLAPEDDPETTDVDESTIHYLSYVDDEHNPYEALFERYEKLSKGLVQRLSAEEKEILAEINAPQTDIYKLVSGDISGKEYYENTTYGELVKEYEKLLKAQSDEGGFETLDKTLYDKYTNNGTRTYEEGFDQEELNIAQTQTITKGWYVQKSSPSLDSAGTITGRLFQTSVSNAKIEVMNSEDVRLDADQSHWDPQHPEIGQLAKADRVVWDSTESEWALRSEPSADENKFLCSINGAFFLKKDLNPTDDDYTNDIVFQDDNAYYIVQVVEAAKDSKLRNGLYDNSYAKSRGQTFLNDVIAQITRKVAETGSYASLAKEHWLEEMSIKYHDTTVYKYFKDNYPDLFD